MRHSSRLQACIEIYEKIGAAKIPMDNVVGDYMRTRRYIGAKDRAAIAEKVYAIMRLWGRLTWWLEKAGADPTPRNLMIAHAVLAERADEKKLKELFDASKFSPEELNAEEIEFFEKIKGKDLNDPSMPEAVRVECPPEYESALRGYFGDDFSAEMEALQKSATLDLRVNTFLAPREKIMESLKKDDVETDETELSPWGLRARGKVFISKSKAFAKGLVEIQDEGSQMIAHVCGARAGMQVLDFCAGGGGKTLALAAAMERKGRIVATDMDERRLQKGKERFRKAQVSDIIEIRPLTDERHRKWLRRQKETFDIVLLDVLAQARAHGAATRINAGGFMAPALRNWSKRKAKFWTRSPDASNRAANWSMRHVRSCPPKTRIRLRRFWNGIRTIKSRPLMKNSENPSCA